MFPRIRIRRPIVATMKKYLKQVRELAEQHATVSRQGEPLTTAQLETLADEG